jgi:glycosyltransferase involved in cell wall biosynthesis
MERSLPRMKFSIVIPSYQHAEFLPATLASVLTQDYADREILVRDGGSTDGTVEILRTLETEGNLRWVSGPDGGQADAINAGLKEATGDILAYLNSDDVYYPHALARAAEYFAAHPECFVLYGNADHLHRDGTKMESYSVEPWNYDRLPMVCYLCQPAVFWRRAVMERFGMFDPRLHFAIDYEYWLRIGKEIPFHHLDGPPLAGSRLHADTKTLSQRVPAHEEALQVVIRHGGDRAAILKWLRAVAEFRLAQISPRPRSRLARAVIYAKNLFAAAWKFSVPIQADMFADAKAALVSREM